jgi:hypothetical protein
VLAALLLPAPAAALDVGVWPLFHLTTDAAAGSLRWTALGPLLQWERTRDHAELLIRPLLRLRLDADGDARADVLFPLVTAQRSGAHRSWRFLLFRHAARDGGASDTTLFPLVVWRDDPAQGASRAVLPFWADLHGVLGFDAIQALLFPLWLRVEDQGVARQWHPFPFVSTVTGRGAHGLRLWPFWGETTIPGREASRFVLWPFYVESTRHDPRYGDEHRLLVLPVWASLEGPQRTSTGWGVLGYTHTVDRVLGSEAVGSPWPFAYRERALGEATWRVERWAPLWGRSDVGGIRSRFWLWPLARATDQDADDFHYRRRDGLLFLFRDETQWNEATGRRAGLWTLFPLLRQTVADHRVAGQVPALLDALAPRSRGVDALWAPLWSLLAWRSGADGTLDWSLAWGLLGREDGRLRGPLHWSDDPPAREARHG